MTEHPTTTTDMITAVAGTCFLDSLEIRRILGRGESEVNSANIRPVVYREELHAEAAAVMTTKLTTEAAP